MKIRTNFVSNSSSSSFIITNTSNTNKTIVDFVKENPQLSSEYDNAYWGLIPGQNTHELILASAKERLNSDPSTYTFSPGEGKELIFGDEEEDKIGGVYDYVLRRGGRSNSFSWYFNESLR